MEDRRSDAWRQERRQQIAAALARQRDKIDAPSPSPAPLPEELRRQIAEALDSNSRRTPEPMAIDSRVNRRARVGQSFQNFVWGLLMLPVVALVVVVVLGVLGVGARVLVGLARLAGG